MNPIKTTNARIQNIINGDSTHHHDHAAIDVMVNFPIKKNT
jgi:hypothetical protein